MKKGIFQTELAAVMQPRVLLKPESWVSKIEFINHLVLFNNVLITVLSEKEGGKSSFSILLQNNLDSQIKLLAIAVKAPCNHQQIINDIATQFHLKYDDHSDISSLVGQINVRKAHVLLLIDEAQHLPETFIKEVMLAIKNQENLSFFHLCLISDYSIVAALNGFSTSFFNDLVHTIELGGLNEKEARTYTLQRAMATHLITKPLTDAQFQQFYQLTKGNVAKINNSLEAFIFNCSAKKPKNVRQILKNVTLPLVTALLSGAACLFLAKGYYPDPINEVIHPKAVEPLVSEIAAWDNSVTRELIDYTLAEKQNLNPVNKDLSSQSAVLAIADKAVFHAKIEMAKLNIHPETLANHSQLVKKSVINTEKLYTIQLIASTDKEDMEQYRKNNKSLDAARVNHYVKNKVVWYVLTLGEYNTIADAQQTMNHLPPALMKLNPWIRSVSTLG